MMAVDINVENAGIGAEEFKYPEDNVVYVAKTRCFAFFRVM